MLCTACAGDGGLFKGRGRGDNGGSGTPFCLCAIRFALPLIDNERQTSEEKKSFDEIYYDTYCHKAAFVRRKFISKEKFEQDGFFYLNAREDHIRRNGIVLEFDENRVLFRNEGDIFSHVLFCVVGTKVPPFEIHTGLSCHGRDERICYKSAYNDGAVNRAIAAVAGDGTRAEHQDAAFGGVTAGDTAIGVTMVPQDGVFLQGLFGKHGQVDSPLFVVADFNVSAPDGFPPCVENTKYVYVLFPQGIIG